MTEKFFFLPSPSVFIAPVPAPAGKEVYYPDAVDAGMWNVGLLYLASLVFVFYTAGSFFGLLRSRSLLRTGVSRKLFCMTIFSLGFVIPRITSFQLAALSLLVTTLLILSLSEKVRSRFPPSRLTFLAVSREGEHDKTVLWLWTESLVTSLVIFFGASLVQESGKGFYPWFMLYPALVSGLSDACAEIVGSTWGKRKYRTIAFFDERTFARTLEGSLAFFVVTCVISVLMGQLMPPDQRAFFALLALPFILTLTEALSPHSWDNPFLFLMSYLTVFAIYSV